MKLDGYLHGFTASSLGLPGFFLDDRSEFYAKNVGLEGNSQAHAELTISLSRLLVKFTISLLEYFLDVGIH